MASTEKQAEKAAGKAEAAAEKAKVAAEKLAKEKAEAKEAEEKAAAEAKEAEEKAKAEMKAAEKTPHQKEIDEVLELVELSEDPMDLLLSAQAEYAKRHPINL